VSAWQVLLRERGSTPEGTDEEGRRGLMGDGAQPLGSCGMHRRGRERWASDESQSRALAVVLGFAARLRGSKLKRP
jgi:hypothetical protein